MTSVAVIAGQGKSIVRDSLKLYYDFSLSQCYPGSGTTVTDLSDTGNHGTLQASPVFTNTGYFTFASASSRYISTTTSFTNPSPYSVGVWFRTTATNGHPMIEFENAQTGTGTTLFDRMITVCTDGLVRFGNWDGSLPADIAASTATYNDGAWHYAVGTYGGEGTTMRLYVDGISVGTATTTSTQNITGWWRIAGYKVNADWTGMVTGYFDGDIGAAMIYGKGLTAGEVAQNFNAMRGRFGV